MAEGFGVVGLLVVLLGIVLVIVLILAPLKLYSIDSNVLHIQKQLEAISGQIAQESAYLQAISVNIANSTRTQAPPSD